MADVLAIAERKMTVVIAAITTLILKAEIGIRPHPNNATLVLVGSSPVAKEAIEVLENPSELRVKAPWRLEAGERSILGLNGLQRRISSGAEGQDECYFIPSRYLRRVIER